MRIGRWLARSIILGVFLSTRGLATEPRDVAARIVAAIAQLGSVKSADRESASRLLEAMGTAALPLLREAGQHSEAEIRHRARLLVRQIERRADTERILQPTHIRLSYRNVSLAEATADLSRQTGFKITFDGDRARFHRQTLELDVQATTIWDAVAQFFQKAGLTDALVFAPPPEAGRFDGWDRGVIDVSELSDGSSHQPALAIRFKQDEAPAPSVFHAGSIRLRVLPSSSSLAGHLRHGGELQFGLEIGLEPRLRPIAVMAVRIDHAVDDRGQILLQPAAAIAGAGTIAGGQRDEVILAWEGETVLPGDLPGSAGSAPIRLRATGPLPRRLKELRGVLALQVQTPSEALITVVDPAIERRPASGVDGSSLKVINHNQDAGAFKLRVELTPAPRDLFLNGSPARILLVNGGRWRGRGVPVPPPANARQFILLDDKGQSLRQTGRPIPTVGSNGAAWEFTLGFQPGAGQGPPRKLLFHGRRTLTIEVPFIFQDISL